MSEIFISYARSTATQAQAVAEALRGLGYDVWRDDELPAHRAYADVIEERLLAAKAVVVVWSAEAVRSEWVQSEADQARAARKLVQLTLDGAKLPMPFDRIQCADLTGWTGDLDAPGWRKVAASIAELMGGPASHAAAPAAPASARQQSICVLPFANMSGDAEQEYFSDGISEDIITDLSKVSALSVVARNTAFTFKGRAFDLSQVARQLNVSHFLEGSVRKVGNRVRISAQLIDAAAGDHVWAERYDRDLTDIFALQDEISEAVVKALKLKLLPEEKQAIEQRGTTSSDAYNLYLMARQYWVSGNDGDSRRDESILRICRRATDIDPNYARAWALMALTQTALRFRHGKLENDGLAAAERALALDANLAEAHCVMARHLAEQGLHDQANAEIELALQLDAESWEVNKEAGRLIFRQGRIAAAVPFFEKAAALMETDYHDPLMLITCYTALGDAVGVQRAAQAVVGRAEKALAHDSSNGAAMASIANGLACLGEAERAREWTRRALLIDPENLIMRYNLACCIGNYVHDADAALELLGPYFIKGTMPEIRHAEVDPDMDHLRADPRFQSMVADAHRRLAAANEPGSPPAD
ncbi:TIR domain-containing protein [Phenylobacterium sp.]|jgi:adenylate cyclase|uniref:TIR domain-containing protein n=1 Tax=Phenylobacterium sp. TaxID=1871053 RepID=UPI002F3E5454